MEVKIVSGFRPSRGGIYPDAVASMAPPYRLRAEVQRRMYRWREVGLIEAARTALKVVRAHMEGEEDRIIETVGLLRAEAAERTPQSPGVR